METTWSIKMELTTETKDMEKFFMRQKARQSPSDKTAGEQNLSSLCFLLSFRQFKRNQYTFVVGGPYTHRLHEAVTRGFHDSF